MPRALPRTKPFFRKARNRWHVQIDGRQVNLGADKEKAFARSHQLMADAATGTPSLPRADTPKSITFLADHFLEWVQRNRAPDTYEWYRYRLQRFIADCIFRRSFKDCGGLVSFAFRNRSVLKWSESKSEDIVDTTQNQLEQFHQFALGRLDKGGGGNGGRWLTLDELFDEWRINNPTPEAHTENCKAILASLNDFDQGQRGVDADEFLSDFRARNGIK